MKRWGIIGNVDVDSQGLPRLRLTGSITSTTPVVVAGLENNVSNVSAGFDHTCAVRNGALTCWGSNFARQLGNPNGSLNLETVRVP